MTLEHYATSYRQGFDMCSLKYAARWDMQWRAGFLSLRTAGVRCGVKLPHIDHDSTGVIGHEKPFDCIPHFKQVGSGSYNLKSW